ncbi:nuclear transport factor 2 family protein [Micromonospora sp. NPDC023644]|uniref:YybH family protein n=1 Tax=Micromonospora sp. NPDC023644 TaxID=3154321 RepID=UPI00340346D7
MKKVALAVMVTMLGGLLVAPAQASPPEADRERRRPSCASRFDHTVRQRDAAFAARDVDRLMTFYRPDAVEIDPSGAHHPDRAAITAHLTNLFTLTFESTFVERQRVVDGCDTALLVLDSRFRIPEFGVDQHFVTAQTFTYERGEWKLLLAANTMLPA